MLPPNHCGGIISSWSHILNSVFIAEPIEYLACKLGTVIMDDLPRDTESMDDMVFDEINHVGSFDFNQWYGFCPLWKVIGYRQDKPVSFCRRGADWPYDIDSPCFKWPWSNGWMKQLWRLMYEIRMDLACFTPSCILDGIGYHGWPIVPKPVQSVLEFRTGWWTLHIPSCASCLRIREATE